MKGHRKVESHSLRGVLFLFVEVSAYNEHKGPKLLDHTKNEHMGTLLALSLLREQSVLTEFGVSGLSRGLWHSDTRLYNRSQEVGGRVGF